MFTLGIGRILNLSAASKSCATSLQHSTFLSSVQSLQYTTVTPQLSKCPLEAKGPTPQPEKENRTGLYDFAALCSETEKENTPRPMIIYEQHPDSKIAFVSYEIPENETAAEKEWRITNERLLLREHEFWKDNNAQFRSFMDAHKHIEESERLRLWLESSRQRLGQYNKEWHKTIFALTFPFIRASWAKWKRGLGSKPQSHKSMSDSLSQKSAS